MATDVADATPAPKSVPPGSMAVTAADDASDEILSSDFSMSWNAFFGRRNIRVTGTLAFIFQFFLGGF
jgi:hypothetical protein